MLIGELWLAISLPLNGAETDLRQTLLSVALFPEMKTGIAAVTRKLASLPRRADASARIRSAGSPFRMIPFASLPTDVAGWKKYLRDRVTATVALRARLESPENTIPLEASDITQILNPLKVSDDALLILLGRDTHGLPHP